MKMEKGIFYRDSDLENLTSDKRNRGLLKTGENRKIDTFYVQKKRDKALLVLNIFILLHQQMGKCCTASSLQILQGLTAAKVVGCSSAIQRAFPPRLFSSVGQST